MQITQKKGGVILSYVQMVFNVLVKFIYTPFLLRALGQNEYGLYSLAMSIVGYMSVLEFGFGKTVTRYTVKYESENDRDSLYRLFSTLSVIYIIIGVLALFACLLVGYFSPSLFSNTMMAEEITKMKVMMLLCGINLLFTFPLHIAASVLVAYERFIFRNGIKLFQTIFQPVVLILLLYLVHIKSVGAIVVVTSFNLLTYLAYYIYAVKKLNFRFSLWCFDKSMIRGLLTFSIWMFFLVIFEQLQFNSGQLIISLFQGTEIVAIWGVAMIFILNYRSISTAVTNVFLPSYLSNTFQDDVVSLEKTTMKMVRIQSYVLFTILLNFILFGEYFINLWAGSAYSDVYKLVLIVMFPMSISLLLDFCYLTQIATNKLKYRIATLFSSYIISFGFVYCMKGINLVSYSYIMAGSIVLGQIICVVVYVRKNINVNLLDLVKVLIKMWAIPFILTAILFFGLRSIPSYQSSVAVFLVSVLMYNLLLGILLWFTAFSKEEKSMLKNIVVK